MWSRTTGWSLCETIPAIPPDTPFVRKEGLVRRLWPRTIGSSIRCAARGRRQILIQDGYAFPGTRRSICVAEKLLDIRERYGAEGVAFAVTTKSGTGIADSIEWIDRFSSLIWKPEHRELHRRLQLASGRRASVHVRRRHADRRLRACRAHHSLGAQSDQHLARSSGRDRAWPCEWCSHDRRRSASHTSRRRCRRLAPGSARHRCSFGAGYFQSPDPGRRSRPGVSQAMDECADACARVRWTVSKSAGSSA